MTDRVRAYRTCVADGATHIDILIATYDGLAEDVRLAGEAACVGNVANRCKHSRHGFLLLGLLESWVELLDDDPRLRDSLNRFYSYIRAELLRLQGAPEQAGFSRLAMNICKVRAAWQEKQSMRKGAHADHAATCPSEPAPISDESRFCWSA